jgi:glutathione S-transferase
MYTLFYAPGACSLASHIVLEEIEATFEPVRLDLMAGDQHKPEFRAVNPGGKVPALVTPAGTLTESPAILAFLADSAPAFGLVPRDPFARAQCASTMAWLSSTVHVAFGRYWRQAALTSEESAWPDMKQKAADDIAAAFARLDQKLDGTDWMHAAFSVVDPYVLVMRRWGSRIGLDMTAFPNLVAHGARVAARPATQRALAREGIRIDG